MSIWDSSSLALSKSARVYFQMFLGLLGFALTWICHFMVARIPLWSDVSSGGMTVQSWTWSGEEERTRSMRVALPLDVTWVGCDTSCTNEKLSKILRSLENKGWFTFKKSTLKSPKTKTCEKRETFKFTKVEYKLSKKVVEEEGGWYSKQTQIFLLPLCTERAKNSKSRGPWEIILNSKQSLMYTVTPPPFLFRSLLTMLKFGIAISQLRISPLSQLSVIQIN